MMPSRKYTWTVRLRILLFTSKLEDDIFAYTSAEVQDQRSIEIELLLHLVQNPRGIHFGVSLCQYLGYFLWLTEKLTAGDSAQCISNDSAFRFANVKALFYDHYSRLDPELAKPELFSLSKNFRSHQGILSLASFIMELLWQGIYIPDPQIICPCISSCAAYHGVGFPNMVDKLSPEIGQFHGPKPVIFGM